MNPPHASRELIEPLARAAWANCKLVEGRPFPEFYLFGVRGYRSQSMGPTKGNDVGIYDDALFMVSPSKFIPQNGNTDPSRLGWNPGVGKPFAVLQPGVWYFRRGPHKGKVPALRQCTDEEASALGIPRDGEFLVERSYGPGNKSNFKEWGYFAINMHPGGASGTSSWGCQTIPREDAEDFLLAVWDESKRLKVNAIPYILIEGPVN